jgi:spermidine synthase
VLLSGIAGLTYQVAWTRQVAGITSAMMTAQSVVLAVFMGGLGLGALWSGSRARRSKRPLLLYAAAEVAALLAAAASSRVLVLIGDLGPVPTSVKLAVVCAYLLLPASALGMSLPFMIEHCERSFGLETPAERGRVAAWVYSVNTFGAVLGCYGAGFVTIEHLGLRGTILLGVSMAGLAVVISGLLSLRYEAPWERNAAAAPDAGGTTREPPGLGRPLLVIAAASGLFGLAAEVVWTRLVSLVVLTTIYSVAQVLGSVLVGITLGAWLSAAISSASAVQRAPERMGLQAAGGLLAAAAIGMAAVPACILALAHDEQWRLELATGQFGAGSLLLLIALAAPSALVAAVLPLLVTVSKATSGSSAFGKLYAANTVGAVVGSSGAGLVLLPWLGLANSALVLEVGCLSCAAWLIARSSRWRDGLTIAGLGAVACGVLQRTVDVPLDIYAPRLEPGTTVLALKEGLESDVMVTQNALGTRRLWINSSWVAGTGGGHRLLGHLPALFVEAPKRALGIALGTGQTFASLLRHQAEEFHCVELNEGVLALSARYFADVNQGLFSDPRVTVHHDDGRAFLRRTDLRFDVIVLEPLQAWSVGTSNLYSVEFYAEAKRALAADGTLGQWIPFYGQGVEETRAMVASAAEVFPHLSLWLDDRDGILIAHEQPFMLDPRVLDQRIEARGLAAELSANAAATARDLMALLLLDSEGVDQWVRGAKRITDDRPFLEFAAARSLGVDSLPGIVASMNEAMAPLERALVKGTSGVDSSRVSRVRDALLAERVRPLDDHIGRVQALEAGLRHAPASAPLRRRYQSAILHWANLPDVRGNLELQRKIYQRALANDPTMGRAAFNLAIVSLQLGDPRAASSALNAAERLGSVPPGGERLRKAIDAESPPPTMSSPHPGAEPTPDPSQ